MDDESVESVMKPRADDEAAMMVNHLYILSYDYSSTVTLELL